MLNRDGLLCWLVIDILRDQLAMTAPTAPRSLVFLASLPLESRMYHLPVIGLAAAVLAGAPCPCGECQARHLKAAGASPSSRLRHIAIFSLG